MAVTDEQFAEALDRIAALEGAVRSLTEHVERQFDYMHILNAKVDDHHQLHVDFIEHHVDTGDIATASLAIVLEPDEAAANTLAIELQDRVGAKRGAAMKRDEIDDSFGEDEHKARSHCARRACDQHRQRAEELAVKISQNGNGRADAAMREDIVARRDRLKAIREETAAAKAKRGRQAQNG